MSIIELMNKIGIKTFGELQKFKKECAKNKDVKIALKEYLENLGSDFKIREEN